MIEMRGRVEEILPDSRCRVVLQNGHELVAYTGGKMKKHRIRIIAGDDVTLEAVPVRPHQGPHHVPTPAGAQAAHRPPAAAPLTRTAARASASAVAGGGQSGLDFPRGTPSWHDPPLGPTKVVALLRAGNPAAAIAQIKVAPSARELQALQKAPRHAAAGRTMERRRRRDPRQHRRRFPRRALHRSP
jgi:translation initiation factor IF-1